MASRSPARPSWRDRRWCTQCRAYFYGAYCGCAWSAWKTQKATASTGAALGWAAPAEDWAHGSRTATWTATQGRGRSTSSGRRRERSLSRQKKPEAIWGTWEQRERLAKLRAAEKACTAAGDSEGAASVAAQCDALVEDMYEALPMHARIAHWEARAAAQAGFLARLKELAALQQSKLTKTKAAVLAAEEELSTQQRKLSDLAAEQPRWGPITELAAHDPYGGGDSWDSYVWCYDSMSYVWRDSAPPRPAALHAPAAAAAGGDAGLLADQELKNGLLQLLGKFMRMRPTPTLGALRRRYSASRPAWP